MPPTVTDKLAPVWGLSITKSTQYTVMSYVTQGMTWYSSRPMTTAPSPKGMVEELGGGGGDG